ncbi:UDP-GlcNAc:undecaprenyl-phosphate GlcNAc-1-phosphate transferase [Nakamurella sp. UYEF19]|uniref:MraY family glycosyltransferase n=1 Tax=Nakamurella sp. UYEF19 TaxID=1756392 RepID=UPI00339397AB
MADIAIPVREYALVFGTAAFVTFIATGGVRLLASKIGAVTPIRDRDVHKLPTPRMGGVAVYLGVAAAILIARNMPVVGRAFDSSSSIQGVLAAGGVIVLVGVLDDRFDLDAITKLFGQILAAGVLVLYGVTWLQVWLPSGDGGTTVSFSQTQGALITVLITVVLANAMNFIDGLDGLLAGVATISAVAVFIFSVHQLMASADDSVGSQPPLIAAALVGACLGFLPHNFYPARIFMGDSGSMFIGLTMAASVITASGQLNSSNFGPRSTVALLAPVIVVLAVVFIPLLDFLLAVIRRTKEGRHPFSADKRHLHHRMLAIGHTHRQAVLIFYLWAFVLSAGSVSLVFARWQEVVLPTAGAALVALLISMWPWLRSRRLTRRRALGVVSKGPVVVGAKPTVGTQAGDGAGSTP